MKSTSTRSIVVLVALLIASTACGSGTGTSRQVPVGGAGTPTSPTTGGPITLSTPQAVSPTNGEQLSTLRPTLTVQNATSSQTGSRTYEFQVSDRSDFALGASLAASFLVAVNQTGVAEGSDGRTSFTVGSDLQPTTRMYWRSRVVQGTSASSWSEPAMFKTKLVGYSRPGELYDPLVHGETIGTVVGSVTFINGKGVQLNNQTSYIRYQLAETITNGEFSVIAENLAPGAAGSKFKIFSMQSGTGNLIDNPYLANVQYRGAIDGNPDNSFSFKVLYGSFADSRKFEPDRANRIQRNLDPSKAYFWKWTWGPEARLLVQEGIGGATLYNYGVPTAGTYAPSPHYAYLGANTTITVEEGSRPGVVISQVWIGNKPRPTTLGNALD